MSNLLEVRSLKTHFSTPEGVVKAADDVSFTIAPREVVGLVGESGCGKSVLALSILRLVAPPGKIISGEVFYQLTDVGAPVDLLKFSKAQMRKIRGKHIAMIFQEPMNCLNPVLTVGNQIGEAVALHEGGGSAYVRERTLAMLELVGISDPHLRIRDYPHQLSGGMRQRVMIAIALAMRPRLLIADEPTTSLDVTIQAQILELLMKLREELGMAILLVTHDFGIVAEVASRVLVMYAGHIVEEAKVNDIFTSPQHPYTKLLLASIPPLKKVPDTCTLETIPGQVPSLIDLPYGCYFQDRCPKVENHCREVTPQLEKMGADRKVRCFFPG